MIHVGVDPGQKGALAVIWSNGVADFEQMPYVDGAPDVLAIATLLQSRWRRADLDEPMFVTVEYLAYMPARFGGGKTNWWRGGWHWLFETLLTLEQIPHQFVRPQQWQKEMLRGTSGTTKERAMTAARRLFPLHRIRNDGQAEALLIAEFGRRMHGGA